MMMRGVGSFHDIAAWNPPETGNGYVETVQIGSGWGPVDPDAPATEALPTGGVPELELSRRVWDPEIGAFVLVKGTVGGTVWDPIRTVVPLLKPFQVKVFPPEKTFLGMSANTVLTMGLVIGGLGFVMSLMKR